MSRVEMTKYLTNWVSRGPGGCDEVILLSVSKNETQDEDESYQEQLISVKALESVGVGEKK